MPLFVRLDSVQLPLSVHVQPLSIVTSALSLTAIIYVLFKPPEKMYTACIYTFGFIPILPRISPPPHENGVSFKSRANNYAYFMHIISIYIFTFAVIGTIIALSATLCGVFLFMKGVVGYE